MKHKITVTVNGHKNTSEVESRLLLIHYLRDTLFLTGSHCGCETSLCGACTVAIDGLAVKSCTMFAVQCDGREIVTIEGIAPNGKRSMGYNMLNIEMPRSAKPKITPEEFQRLLQEQRKGLLEREPVR